MDKTDLHILRILLEDARTPYIEIARQCNIAGSLVHLRIRKMEQSGVIQGMRVQLDPAALGYDICAFVQVKVVQSNVTESVVEKLKELKEVIECHYIIGPFAILLKMYCRNNAHLMDLLSNKIIKIPGVAATNSYLSLKQFIDHPIPIEH